MDQSAKFGNLFVFPDVSGGRENHNNEKDETSGDAAFLYLGDLAGHGKS